MELYRHYAASSLNVSVICFEIWLGSAVSILSVSRMREIDPSPINAPPVMSPPNDFTPLILRSTTCCTPSTSSTQIANSFFLFTSVTIICSACFSFSRFSSSPSSMRSGIILSILSCLTIHFPCPTTFLISVFCILAVS